MHENCLTSGAHLFEVSSQPAQISNEFQWTCFLWCLYGLKSSFNVPTVLQSAV